MAHIVMSRRSEGLLAGKAYSLLPVPVALYLFIRTQVQRPMLTLMAKEDGEANELSLSH